MVFIVMIRSRGKQGRSKNGEPTFSSDCHELRAGDTRPGIPPPPDISAWPRSASDGLPHKYHPPHFGGQDLSPPLRTHQLGYPGLCLSLLLQCWNSNHQGFHVGAEDQSQILMLAQHSKDLPSPFKETLISMYNGTK